MTLKECFYRAQKKQWALGHFNFSTPDQLRGIVAAAKKLSSPVIVATSEGELEFWGAEEAVALVRILENKTGQRLFLHFDHGREWRLLKKTIDFGYDSVHFDGSHLDFKENIRLTKKVVDYAHQRGVWVEAELGLISGSSRPFKKKFKIKEKNLTRPEEVAEFVKKTKADSLAVAVGSAHGIYPKKEKIDFKLLKEIRKQTNVYLVLHGASGVSPADLKKAIKSGIQKININTDLRIVWKRALKKAIAGTEVKPYLLLPQASEAVEQKVREYLKIFKSTNQLK